MTVVSTYAMFSVVPVSSSSVNDLNQQNNRWSIEALRG